MAGGDICIVLGDIGIRSNGNAHGVTVGRVSLHIANGEAAVKQGIGGIGMRYFAVGAIDRNGIVTKQVLNGRVGGLIRCGRFSDVDCVPHCAVKPLRFWVC